MTQITHIKITQYIDDTKKRQIKAAVIAAPSLVFYAISSKHD